MTPSVNKSKLYDFVKCLTTMLVVIAHATRMYTPARAVIIAGESAFLAGVTEYVYVFHMPLFMMLSGCVFGYCIEKGKYTDISRFIKGKAKKLLIPYLAFGLFYVAPVMCILGLTNLSAGEYLLRGVLLSYDSRHLWYMLALFWIFLLYILLRPLLLGGKRELLTVSAISIALLCVSGAMPAALQISAACNNQFFFLLGVLFNRFYDRIERCARRLGAAVLLLPLLLIVRFVYNPNIVIAYGYKVVGVMAAMLLGWYVLVRFPGAVSGRGIGVIREHAFGVYLFHPMIVYVLFYALGRFERFPVLLCAGIVAAATLLSILATRIARKLRLGWVIGE